MANLNLNYTSSAGVIPVEVSQFMYRNFLPRITNTRVYGRDLQMRSLPAHNGKRVTFNKMNPFSVDTTPLKEGVTPDGQLVVTSQLSATVKPYGKYTSLTDEIDWAVIDGFKQNISIRLGDQAHDTLEAIDRYNLSCGLNVQYTGTNTSRSTIAATDILTYAAIKKAVRTLEINQAKPFSDGFFHAIIDPATKYDLMGDQMWIDIAKYQDASKLEYGEVGKMYKVKFFEASQPMLFKKETYLYGTVSSLATTAYDATNKILTIAATTVSATSDRQDIEYFVRQMTGRMINISDSSESATIPAVIDHIIYDGTNIKVYLRWIASSYTWGASDTIVPMGAGSSDYDVHGTIVYGQDFAGGVALEGNGKNVQMIVKPLGSSGTDDPLNQRGTMGWKVKGYTSTILQDAFIVRIEHGVTA